MDEINLKPPILKGALKRGCRAGLLRCRALLRDDRAALLLEAIVGVTVLITVAGSTLVGLSASQRVRVTLDRQAFAENLVRNQMEYIISLSYHTSTNAYPTITSTPSGYSVLAAQELVDASDDDLQKISVTVTHEGESILVVDTLRSND